MDFADLWKFRNFLILKELLYIVVTKMPKAEFPKIKGVICNVPKDVGGICKIVPRQRYGHQQCVTFLSQKQV